jgi:SHS2 domain-containing protein
VSEEAGYRILEHTADIGIESWGATVTEAFEQAAWGLAEILGARSPGGESESIKVRATGSDVGALLVDFLNELLLLHETREVAFARIAVERMTDTELEADVGVAPIEGETETTGVKAATYHRLEVRETPDGVRARVYLDV